MGYHRAGFEVTGVDIKFQKRYPFKFIQADALKYLAEHGHEYDAIHASPPCQRYSFCTPMAYRMFHPDLIAPTRQALVACGRPYIIENVTNARHELVDPVMLCGTMFGLPLWRHRYFEMPWWPNPLMHPCNHSELPVLVSGTCRRKKGGRFEYTVKERGDAAGIDWMVDSELDEAIPPAYTEYIGKWLMKYLPLPEGQERQ